MNSAVIFPLFAGLIANCFFVAMIFLSSRDRRSAELRHKAEVQALQRELNAHRELKAVLEETVKELKKQRPLDREDF